MAADNYKEILQEVCEKLNNIDSVKETDILNIKNSVEAIESLITDTQAKLNFQDIKEKLENISFQMDNSNEGILKDLFNDINSLKESTGNVGKCLENIQNLQNLTVTSSEFEEYQKRQLDLALKTNENIFNELTYIKENISSTPNGENVKNLEEQLSNIHDNLSDYIEQLVKKIPEVPSLDEIGAIMSDLNSVHQKNIKQTNQLIKDLQSKFSSFKDDFESKDFENQIEKISEIYDSLSKINLWVEKVGYVNQAIENVYARLGENVDFDEVSEKVDIIYENITALNNWSMKIDNVQDTVTQLKSDISSFSDFQETTKNISESINNLKEHLSSNNSLEGIDFEDFINKIDLIYDNLGMLNDWVSKIDDIVKRSNDLDLKFQQTSDNISSKLQDAIENFNFQFDEANENITQLDFKIQAVEDTFSIKLKEADENITSKLDDINNDINSKLQETNDNINLKFDETNDNLNSKIDEISQTVANSASNTDKIVQDVPDIKATLETLASDLHAITNTTKSDGDSYIYTLMDIESDFEKLHKSIDDNKKIASDDIQSIKECFAELNEDISSISIRTNKLILSADDANKEFKTYLDTFKNVINSFENQNQANNLSLKFDLLCSNVSEMIKLLNKSVNANNNLNTAFTYLAEWIDATGGVLNNIQDELSQLKSNKTIDTLPTVEIKEKTSNPEEFTSLNENISELKSLLTGIIVQLNTALTPDIDSLNERIDKLCDENNNKLTQLEILLQEKVIEQEKKIVVLEEKIDKMSEKFDRLVEVMADDSHSYEIKDILNFIASQINTNVVNIQNTNTTINEVAQKLDSFDANMNKIVSYIEED